MQQLILLRWIAVVGQIFTIEVAWYGFGMQLPYAPMLAIVGALALFNVASQLYWRRRGRISGLALLLALAVDVASLTAQLYLSGGLTNPFAFLYLLQVALGAMLLQPALSWILVVATSLCLVGLTAWPGPTSLPLDPARGLHDRYVLGLLVCFVLVASLLVIFITRIARIIRARDAHLAALRQQAAEEEHIVRMGLLASGAAHELGTPLSTLAVILRDWQHLPHFHSDPELLSDVEEMQRQVARCKAIVTGILLSAGETRGDAPAQTTLRAFFAGLAQEWQERRAAHAFHYVDRLGPDVAIVSDTGLRQMIGNILDNALEASPEGLELLACREDDRLRIEVNDRGPGFAAAMLATLGQPYHSTKGRRGGGLGLFLSQNVARTLGGKLEARNRAEGGAQVSVTLPLSSLVLEDAHDA